MTDPVHISSFDEDDDGWPIVRCSCGFQFGPVPDMETAADVWGDHQYEVAAALDGAPATPAEWPKWLTPEHTNIHTAIENAMKQALAHCYGSADASGYGWTMGGLFSVAANSIMGVLRDAGCPPPAVGDVEAIPMPEDTWLVDEDESDEDAPATPAKAGDALVGLDLDPYDGLPVDGPQEDDAPPATPAERAVIDAAVAFADAWVAGAEGPVADQPRATTERRQLLVAVGRLWNADHQADDPAGLRAERNKTDG